MCEEELEHACVFRYARCARRGTVPRLVCSLSLLLSERSLMDEYVRSLRALDSALRGSRVARVDDSPSRARLAHQLRRSDHTTVELDILAPMESPKQ